MEDDHQEQVQQYVHHPGDSHVQQGPPGIPHGAEHRAEKIIGGQKGDAQEVDAQVYRSQRQHILRGGHDAQHGHGEDQTDEGGEDASQDSHDGGGLHRLPHAPVILCPEVPGGQHADAAAQSHEHVHHKGDQGAVGSYGSQGDFSLEAAHHDQVGCIEGQLQDAGEHHRQGKGTKLGQKSALAEIDLMSTFHSRDLDHKQIHCMQRNCQRYYARAGGKSIAEKKAQKEQGSCVVVLLRISVCQPAGCSLAYRLSFSRMALPRRQT